MNKTTAETATVQAEYALEALAAGQITTAAAWADRARENQLAAVVDGTATPESAQAVKDSRKAITAWKARAKAERERADDGRN